MTSVVVIGAGQAGASLVMKLRQLKFEGDITLIGEEPHPPYQRPPLSKAYLLGDLTRERLFLKPEAWYADNNVTLRKGVAVEAIDRGAKVVRLEGGDEVAYDKLALTTGAVVNRLPADCGGDLKGIYEVRTLADVDAMEPEFGEGRNVLVIGGGYIGLEAAAVAAKKGMKVTVIVHSERVLRRVAAPETATYFDKLHAEHGVEIRYNTSLVKLTGEGHVAQAELSDGTTIDVDFVVNGTGVKPATALAETAGLTIDNGIATDSFTATSDPDIFSAGDCASFPHHGTRIRLESVGNAIDQAECAAKNMLGQASEYVAKPWFWSDQYDVKLQIAGLNTGYDEIVTRAGEGGVVSFWYYCGDRLIAVDAMNDARGYMVGKRLIEMGKSPDKAAIANPETDLKALMKA